MSVRDHPTVSSDMYSEGLTYQMSSAPITQERKFVNHIYMYTTVQEFRA